MKIQKIASFYLLSICSIGFANQINMSTTRARATQVRSEKVYFDENEEPALDSIIDFNLVGEIEKPSRLEIFLARLVAPFFEFYNWWNKKNFNNI